MVKSLRFGVFLVGIFFCIAIYFVNTCETILPVFNNLDNTSWLEGHLTAYFKEPVHVGDASLTWRGLLHPSLSLNNISIQDESGVEKLHIKKLTIDLDFLTSLSTGKLVPGDISLEGLNLIFKEEGHGLISINDIPILETNLNANHSEKLDALIEAFLSSGQKEVKDLNIFWLDHSGKLILPLRNISATSNSRWFLHNFTGRAALWNNNPINFEGRVIGVVELEHYLFTSLKTEVHALPLQNNPLLQRYLSRINIVKGNGDVSVDLKQNPSKHLQVQGVMHTNNLELFDTKARLRYPLIQIDSHYKLNKLCNDFTLSLDHLNFMMGPEKFPFHNVLFRQKNSLANKQTVLKVDYLPIKPTTEFMTRYRFTNPKIQELITATQPTGFIKNLELNLGNLAQTSEKKISFAGRLKDVSFKPSGNYPGIEHLSGKLHFSPTSGSFTVRNSNMLLTMPKVFREPLPIKSVRSKCEWAIDKKGTYYINAKNYHVVTKEGTATGYLKLTIPKDSSGSVIEAKSSFSMDDLSQASKYYPFSVMSKHLVTWLDQSIKKGVVKHGLFIMKGRLKDFPYDNNRGKFLITGDVSNGSLHYKNDWPSVLNLGAKLRFESRSMNIVANRGLLLGVPVNHIYAHITNLEKPLLELRGNIQASAIKTIKIPRAENPLTNKFNGNELDEMKINGKWSLGLNMLLPLSNTFNINPSYDGTVRFENTSIQLRDPSNSVNKINGLLHFSENSLKSNNLSGELLGHPFKMTMSSRPTASHTTVNEVSLQSSLSDLDLQRIVPKAFSNYIKGEFPISANLLYEVGAKDPLKYCLTLTTDFFGLRSDLPAPFKKEANEKRVSALQIKNDREDLNTTFNLSDLLNGAITGQLVDKQFKFNRGSIEFGNERAHLPKINGLSVTGILSELNWPEWHKVFKSDKNAPVLAGVPEFLSNVDVTIQNLNAFDKRLSPVHIQVAKDANYFNSMIDSETIKGNFKIPYNFPHSPLIANIEHFDILDDSENSKITPRDLFPLDATIERLNYHDRIIKNIALKIRPAGDDLVIKQIQIDEPEMNMSASGMWRSTKSQQSTTLYGELATQNLGAFLNQWHITDNVVKGEGKAHFNLTWSNTPNRPEVKTLVGSMNLNFHQGRIIKLGSQVDFGMGIGRLLNVLSLQTLPRRLKGDFSDLTGSGYSFDQLTSQLQFKHGDIYTDRTYLDGTVGKVKIDGRIGLKNKDYDLRLIINPNVTSSLPLVATLTAGPIIGAATWLVDKVFSREVKKITEIHYNVTGSWQNPTMRNVSQEQVKPT